MKKLCTRCVHCNLNPYYVHGDECGRTGRLTSIERMVWWPFDLINGFCGTRGRWFLPKESKPAQHPKLRTLYCRLRDSETQEKADG